MTKVEYPWLLGTAAIALCAHVSPALAQAQSNQAQSNQARSATTDASRSDEAADTPPAKPKALTGPQAAPSANMAPQGANGVDDTASEIVVTGVRESIRSAQTIKENADQIVDSIQAEDIGKLPDANTVESLQRIAGVQIQRRYGEGGTDVDHRTQSPVAIRGLTQVQTLVDGRAVYSATGGRNFDIEALPPELLAGIDVYKNPSASIIEGGIGGAVNLRTRLPFDHSGQVISATVRGNYYDLADKATGSGSALYSNSWETGIGDIGVLVDGAYTTSKYRQDAILVLPYFDADPANFPGAPANVRAPGGFQIYDELGSRKRFSLAAAVQWQPSDSLTFTLQDLFSRYHFLRTGRYFYNITHGQNPIPTPGANFTYADDGRVLSGSYNNGVFESARYDQDLIAKDNNLSFNAKYEFSPTLSSTLDLQYLKSSYDVDGNGFVISQYADPSELPSNSPNRSIVDFDLSGNPTWTVRDQSLLTDRNRYRFAYLADYRTRNDVDQYAVSYDLKWKPVDAGILKSVAGGVRYSRSNITLRSLSDGFCTFTNGNAASCAADPGEGYVPYTDARSNLVEAGPAPDFFEGRTITGDLYPDFPQGGLSESLTKTYQSFGATRRSGFNPADRNRQSEDSYAGYLTGDFKFAVANLPIDGNAGVRYVRTDSTSRGYIFPTDPTIDPTDASQLQPISVSRSYDSWLPSVNLRAHFTDNLQLRFAFAKAIARPDFGQTATNVSLGAPTSVNPSTGRPSGSAGNPNLDPIRSTQFDLSMEWYFARPGSITAGLFYKKVNGFFASGRDVRTFNGVDYDISTTVNSGDGDIKGFEIAYQQFFDFLPGVLKGLGLQVNYTFVDSNVTNPFAVAGSSVPSRVPLEKLSKHSYNIVGLYDLGPVTARLAYNWRGKYLDTTYGSGANGQPQIQAPYASLDASVSYDITKHLSVTVEAVNLNNRMNKTYIGVPTEPLQYTLNDRRFGLSVRATY